MTESSQVRRTKKHIQSCFLELMAKNGMENITVVELVSYAEINRGTFYNYYRDKYDVLEEIENKLLREYQQLLEEKVSTNLKRMLEMNSGDNLQPFFQGQIATVTNFFHQHRKIVRLLLSDNGDSTFIRKIENDYVAFIKHKLKTHLKIKENEHYYETLFFLRGIIAVIEEWILIEGKETPEEMAEIISRAFYKTPFEMIGIK